MTFKMRVKAFAKKYKFTRSLWYFCKRIVFRFKHPILSTYSKKKRNGYIVQIVSTFAKKDAIGNSAMEISKALHKKRIKNYIVYEASNVKASSAVPLKYFRFNEKDIVIYHMGAGCKSSDIFKSIVVNKKIMVYHNITPGKYFYDSPTSKYYVDLGRKQLLELAKCTDLAICVSKYNENELIKIGYKKTCVVPIPHLVNDLLKYKTSKAPSENKNFLTVGRIARHKCIEDVIKVFNAYHHINPKSFLHIVGTCLNINYEKELLNLVNKFGLANSIKFEGSVDDKELAYFYSQADAYLCMSEHEGFCVPLIEAMGFGVPIFAFDSSAIAETLGGAGQLFNNKNPEKCAKNIHDILNNSNTVANIIECEKNRFLSFDNSSNINLFLSKVVIKS